MTRSRLPDRRTEAAVAPDPDFEVPEPGRPAPHGASFVLQSILEVQRTIGQIDAKVDRLMIDMDSTKTKVDIINHQISFVKGVLWVIGALVALLFATIPIYIHLFVKIH